ncbi:MAG: allantoate amidohydrolase [Geodermatophilaceae bacterium]|nr:allantoate amidohydrolase [Geodermatophilaceae bacterium]
MTFDSMWADLLPVGRLGNGGYQRFAWTAADMACREWFRASAAARGMDVEADRNGNLWAWLGPPGPDSFVTGSHLDSVPGGGAYDGPLGVVSGFAAIDALRERGCTPTRPIAVVAFTDEEGARFGVACLGSRLSTGAADPARTLALTDEDGTRLDEAMRAQGHDPAHAGADSEALQRIGVFVELHVEQGRALVELGAPIGLATAIWPHGRWRYDFTGEGNHAGTTALTDRRDPMLSYAMTVLAARKQARLAGALATFGKVAVDPGGTNAIAAGVTAWLDSRAPDEATLADLVAVIAAQATERAGRDGVQLSVTAESVTPLVDFPAGELDWAATALGNPPRLATGAGHDAGVLATAGVPTAMVFVRNPTGVSHSPAEHAEQDDCRSGVAALTELMVRYAC